MISTDESQLEQDLSTYIPATSRAALQAAVDAAYRDAGKHFDLEAGSDPQLFGFTVFKFVAHQVRRTIEVDRALGLEVLGSSTGAFRLQVGPFILVPYACGRRMPDDPWVEFPGNHNGAGLLADVNSGQIELFPRFESSHTAIVLAHYGNPEVGLEAMFLKKPVAQVGGQISRWGYVEKIFELGDRTARPAHEVPRSPVLPSPAKVVRPTVLPFKKKPMQESGPDGA